MFSKKGFTLLELLVVITIVILFSGGSIAFYNNFAEQKKLEKETKKLITVLDLARKKSNSADASMCTTSFPNVTTKVDYYAVTIQSSSSYKLVPVCAVGTANEITYATDMNIKILTDTGTTISFYSLTSGATQGSITIKNSLLNKCSCVNVNTNGVIEETSCNCPSS